MTHHDIVELLTTAPLNEVIERADEVRREVCGNVVQRRGIIEFSNVCVRTCSYCGLRNTNRTIRRYRMPPEQIVEAARRVRQKGLRTVVLQSGEDPFYSISALSEIIAEIKSWGDMAVTLSIGIRSAQEYQQLNEAGADRYLLKEETADSALYARLHDGQTLATRIQALCTLKSLGFEVGGGVIVGLPGQTATVLANDLLLARELELDMYSVSPFIPHPNTPLADIPSGRLEHTLRMLAAARIVLEVAHLPATTALATLHPNGWEFGLLSGANVIMTSETPAEYRDAYEIYPNRHRRDASPSTHVREMLQRLGRVVGEGIGGSLRREVIVPNPDCDSSKEDAESCSSRAALYEAVGETA